MREKTVEKKLTDGVKKLGGRSYKFISPGNSGVPDRIVICDGKIFFVELKTETGRLSALQKIQIDRLKKLGAKVLVLYGEEDVNKFLRRLSGSVS